MRFCVSVAVKTAVLFTERMDTALTVGVEELMVPGTAPTMGMPVNVIRGVGEMGAGRAPIGVNTAVTPAEQVRVPTTVVATPAVVMEVNATETVGVPPQVPPTTKVAVALATPAPAGTFNPRGNDVVVRLVVRGTEMLAVLEPKIDTTGLVTFVVVRRGNSGQSSHLDLRLRFSLRCAEGPIFFDLWFSFREEVLLEHEDDMLRSEFLLC